MAAVSVINADNFEDEGNYNPQDSKRKENSDNPITERWIIHCNLYVNDESVDFKKLIIDIPDAGTCPLVQ